MIWSIVTSAFKGLFSALLSPIIAAIKAMLFIKVGADEQTKADVEKELSNVEEANRINATIESKSSTDLDRMFRTKQPPNDNSK